MAKGETYTEFVDKFKQKLTTDDCYTPPEIYEVVRDYVAKTYGLDPATFVRPFYPGGDFEAEDYIGKTVVDNPPFSIMTKILDVYTSAGVPFFLFANALTFCNAVKRFPSVSVLCVNNSITYENGAKIRTVFFTNLDPVPVIRSAKDLDRAIKDVTPSKQKPKTPREPNDYTSADLITLARNGEFSVRRERTGKPLGKYYGGAVNIPEFDTFKELPRG